jgi:glycine betaine/choline ABC-type transport system substrate-binding protein
LAGAAALILVVFGLSFRQNISESSSVVDTNKIRVGSKDFTESVILAEILAQILEKRGF